MQNLEPLLREHPFTKGLADEYVALMAGCSANVRFDAGEVIFREGEPANTFYLLRTGCVAIEIFFPHRGTVTITTINGGDVLGWSWLVPPYTWRFGATAVELTRALRLDAECLRTKCDVDPRLGYELFKRLSLVMAERLQATHFQLLDVYGPHD